MSTPTVRSASHGNSDTANDRFKRGSGSTFWSSLTLAVAVHFAIFAFFPDLTVAMPADTEPPPVVIVFPEEVPLPPAPERIERPAVPIATDMEVEYTMPPTRLDLDDVPPLPPPLVTREGEGRPDAFTVFTVAPRLLNRDEVQRTLERLYPSVLRDAGVGARVELRVHLDEQGRMLSAEVSRSGGHEAFDRTALQVARVMRFSPALNRDRRVSVWVSVPLLFEAR